LISIQILEECHISGSGSNIRFPRKGIQGSRDSFDNEKGCRCVPGAHRRRTNKSCQLAFEGTGIWICVHIT
uniref:Ovule protein n=1 Tax=Rodentolepis nana TaxID=102285 RepID=A0A0R3T9G8_RODNA